MTIHLDDRLTIRREFFSLTGIAPSSDATTTDDGAVTEAEETAGDAVNRVLLYGLWDAQEYWVSRCDPDRWKTSTAALSGWLGSDTTTGGRYLALPELFLRAYGDQETSALRRADGTRWGRLVTWEDRSRFGNIYWIENDQLWIGKSSTPPTDLVLDYTARIDEDDFDADTDVPDFPVQHRDLIVGYAANRAMDYAWFPGDMEVKQGIARYLRRAKNRAYSMNRRTREPRKMRVNRGTGTHWLR